jgi:hypothetical protein
MEVREPDWRPFEAALPAQTRAHFMYMGHAGDIVLYKHCDTRRYLNIHAGTGCFFRYVDGQYVEVDREWALQHVGG